MKNCKPHPKVHPQGSLVNMPTNSSLGDSVCNDVSVQNLR